MKKLLFIFLTLCSFVAHAGFDSKESIYANLLTSQNLQNVKLGAKALHHDLPDNVQLWDLAAFTIWSMNHNGDKEDKEFDDTISWLAKAIGESKNGRYQQLLNQQLKLAQSNKIKRYFKSAIKALNNTEVPQFIAAEYTAQIAPSNPKHIRATADNFERIRTGDTLEVVLSLLGNPDGVGQYIRSYSRPFIGRQTFQNLRLSYINFGSMELRYEDTHWIVDLKSKQTNADISAVTAEYRDLLSRLVSNDVTQIRAAAREAIKLPLTDQASLDHIAQYIWDNQGTQDGHFADSLAWLCKVLSNSKNGRYKEVLDTLAQKPIHKKITRYAAKTAKQLSSSTPVFTPAIKTQTANTAQDAKL
ncbi:hypothetical protein [Shewanella sp. GutDb-MelDb]|uniref:hypothetical protein n=1 Tax=Shewanella sp. GutDb-MelDb TaxID=2058316 RepID=UPI000C7A78A1|nr:hypothetical protein [Shewanella sp. GutDb-MelDb]PKG56499.1 hypothetical protein CXF82_14375 [Shewanella sp. GutDb-MelDb]